MNRSQIFLIIHDGLLSRFSDLGRALDKALIDIGSLKEKAKLRLRQYDVAAVEWIDASKLTLLQSLANKYKSSAVIIQALAGASAFVEEYKQVTGKWILFQYVFDAMEKAIVTGPHIHGLFTEINLGTAIRDDHADFFKKSKR